MKLPREQRYFIIALFIFALPLSGCWKKGATYSEKTSFGDPNLQGVWTINSLTTLEAQQGTTAVVVSSREAQRLAAVQRKNWFGLEAHRDLKSGETLAAEHPGGYDFDVWYELGNDLAKIEGKYRSSWIVDPPNGKIPFSDEGRNLLFRYGRGQVNNFDGNTYFDGPEARPHPERCLGFHGGPPIVNSVYNNNFQIAQAPGHIAIIAEMAHDARIVRLGGEHISKEVRPWYGDSIGRWEGNTLVVETTNMNLQQIFSTDPRFTIFLGENPKIIERFTRVSKKEILYRWEIHEPVAFTQVWKGEMPLFLSDHPLIEYACHEGNISLLNTLAGARQREKEKR